MITGGFERLCNVFKNACTMVRNRRCFPVHQLRGTHNFAAENFANALVTEANAEQRNVRSEFTNDLATDSSVARPAWSGRDANAFRNKFPNVSSADLIVASHQNLGAKLTENLREIVGERIVIINQEQHLLWSQPCRLHLRQSLQATRLPLQVFCASDRRQDRHRLAL